MAPLIKIVSAFFACMFGLKMGFPTAFVLFGADFMHVISVSLAGGIVGNVFFTHLSAAILKAIHNYRVKNNLIHKKRFFTKFNRRIIHIKHRFGLAGIAFVSPIFLSTPLGAFLAERFFKNKRKIIIYMSAATIFWTFTLYFVLVFFYDTVKDWLL